MRCFAQRRPVEQQAIGRTITPTDATSQLMELGEAKPLCALDHHDRGFWHIDAYFDYRCCDQ